MKKLALLGVLVGVSYAAWLRFQQWRDTAPNVDWAAGQVGQEISESYLVFGASPVDGGLIGVEGPGGASLLVMTSRMGYHFWKTNPDLVINCRTPGAGDMVGAMNGLVVVSDNRKGRRDLDALVSAFKERASGGGKRLCLRLEGNELKDERIQFGGNIPGKFVRVSRFESMDCGDMIAGM